MIECACIIGPENTPLYLEVFNESKVWQYSPVDRIKFAR